MLLASRMVGSVDAPGGDVLLLHGLFGSSRNLAGLQAALAPRHRVVALDLRNHGASPHGLGMDYTTMAADVAGTLAALGVERCAAVGHSMGGKVAMQLALGFPKRVRRLVVADIAPANYPGVFASHAAAMRAIALAPGLTRAAASDALEAAVPDKALRNFLLTNLMFEGQPAWRIGLDEIIAGMAEILGWAESGQVFNGPTLFVRGARSDYVTEAHMPAIRALFPAAGIATVPDAGHWLHSDNPAGFLAVVASFLG